MGSILAQRALYELAPALWGEFRTPEATGLDPLWGDLARRVSQGQYRFGAGAEKGQPLSAEVARADQRLVLVLALLLREVASAAGIRTHPPALPEALEDFGAPFGGGWLLVGSLEHCLDSFDHRRLASRLTAQFGLHQLVRDLLHQLFRLRRANLSGSYLSSVGTPRDNPLVPLLLELYLGGLDTFVEAGEALAPFRGEKPIPSSAYTATLTPTAAETAAAADLERRRGARVAGRLRRATATAKGAAARREGVSSTLPPAPTTFIRYLRHGDGFLLLVGGSREDTLEVRRRLKSFLVGDLALIGSAISFGLTYPLRESAPFRGYRLRAVALRQGGQRLVRDYPPTEVLEALLQQGLLRRKADGSYLPQSCKRYLSLEPLAIVVALGGVFGALVTHYGGVVNGAELAQLVGYFGRYTAAMTLAHKGSTTTGAIFRRYGRNLELPDGFGGVGVAWPRSVAEMPLPHPPATPLPHPVPYRDIPDLVTKQLDWGHRWVRSRRVPAGDPSPTILRRAVVGAPVGVSTMVETSEVAPPSALTPAPSGYDGPPPQRDGGQPVGGEPSTPASAGDRWRRVQEDFSVFGTYDPSRAPQPSVMAESTVAEEGGITHQLPDGEPIRSFPETTPEVCIFRTIGWICPKLEPTLPQSLPTLESHTVVGLDHFRAQHGLTESAASALAQRGQGSGSANPFL